MFYIQPNGTFSSTTATPSITASALRCCQLSPEESTPMGFSIVGVFVPHNGRHTFISHGSSLKNPKAVSHQARAHVLSGTIISQMQSVTFRAQRTCPWLLYGGKACCDSPAFHTQTLPLDPRQPRRQVCSEKRIRDVQEKESKAPQHMKTFQVYSKTEKESTNPLTVLRLHTGTHICGENMEAARSDVDRN